MHRVHDYARAVLKGKIVVGPLVRLACERHERDMVDSARKGFHFDEVAANHTIGFIEKWVRLPDTADAHGDPKPFLLEPWQAFIVGSIFGWKWTRSRYRRFRNAYIEIGKGNGKALALDTPIPTPDGWTTMGAIQAGDTVFDEAGRKTRVLGAFDVMYGHDCYRVSFDDGSSIVADAGHLWFTEQRTFGECNNRASLLGVPIGQRGRWRKGIRTTQEIANTLRYRNGRYQSANHSIPLAGPLGGDELHLPIEPYVLGVWLGDGDSDCARITIDDREQELVEQLTEAGAEVGERRQSMLHPRTPRYRVGGLQAALRTQQLLKNKHIPQPYLRGSVEQRLALLQGLMDTDGSINKANGQCEFSTTRDGLAEGALELVTSLGIKATSRQYRARIDGRDVSALWRVTFYPPHDLPVFRLRRKVQYQVSRHSRRRLAADRRIVDVQPVPSVPVRCIAVESSSHLYLAGRAMVPTHNTPLLAAVGLYGLMMDGQRAPEIYAAAADRDQAMIMYRDAVRMVAASPELTKRIQNSGIQHVHNMAYGLGFFRAFSREQSGKSGTRPHMGLIDEVHEHPNPDIVNKIRAGAKGNMDALFAEITNSGFDRTSICWQHHEHSRRIVEQAVEDDRWFAYVCTLDEGDDPIADESCWMKVNPNLGVSIYPEYLRDQVSAAKNIPAETNTVLRLNFCVWTQAQTRGIDMAKWRTCQAPPPDSELVGKPCFGALDLGQSDDFSAWIRLWDLLDGRVVVKARFWLPQAALEKYKNRPYGQWKAAKILEITDGDVTDYNVIQAAVLADCQASGVREVGYDKRFAEQMAQNLQGAGLYVVDQPQGFFLNEAIRKKWELIATGELCHGNHEILTWMADNYVVRHGLRGDVRPDKEKAADKIDGQVALDMAIAAWVRQQKKPTPQFQMVVLGGGR